MADLIIERREGLYCPPGDFYIDPSRPVPRAVITHAHADHARGGHGRVLAAADGAGLLRVRLGATLPLQTLRYGEVVVERGVRISLHPAGHVLGSAQVRLEYGGQVWVVSGDYDCRADGEANPTCTAFEPVRCDCFVTESTFGLPVYRWPRQALVFEAIQAWWQANAALGRASVLRGYSLGKAQRLLAGLEAMAGPIVVHPAVRAVNQAYLAAGVRLPATLGLDTLPGGRLPAGALVVAPPGLRGGPYAATLAGAAEAFASGWMLLRGGRARRGGGMGFVLSDHADWDGLTRAIAATGAHRVIVMHGQAQPLARWLQAQGLQAGLFGTAYGGEGEPAERAGAQADGADSLSTPA
ncbi:MAG: ligase-associated DNA damage response exonuclease [Aquabacterium sp.]